MVSVNSLILLVGCGDLAGVDRVLGEGFLVGFGIFFLGGESREVILLTSGLDSSFLKREDLCLVFCRVRSEDDV